MSATDSFGTVNDWVGVASSAIESPADAKMVSKLGLLEF